MNDLLINLAGIAVIALIIWWFWLYKPKLRQPVSADPVDVLVVDGVYTPASIEASRGKPITLRFLRMDPSPCAEKVIFGDFGISGDLSVGKSHELTLTPDKAGEFEFTCQMGMYRGRLLVR